MCVSLISVCSGLHKFLTSHPDDINIVSLQAFRHLSENVLLDLWNPRGFHTYMDEDCMLQIKKLALQMPATGIEERILLHYFIRLSVTK